LATPDKSSTSTSALSVQDGEEIFNKTLDAMLNVYFTGNERSLLKPVLHYHFASDRIFSDQNQQTNASDWILKTSQVHSNKL